MAAVLSASVVPFYLDTFISHFSSIFIPFHLFL
jgi:hypothetical protein